MPVPQADSPVAAIINTSPDTIDLLKDAVERAGFLVVTGYTHDIRNGKLHLGEFLQDHQPSVILYDIAPPYDRSWAFLQHLRSTVMRDYVFVLTTTNPRHVERLAGRDERIYEVVGQPDDLNEIVRATREALRARPTR